MTPAPAPTSIAEPVPAAAPAMPAFPLGPGPADSAPAEEARGSEPDPSELADPWSTTYVRRPTFTPARPDPQACPPPDFPREARFAGSAGIVVLLVRVSARGTVAEVRIEEASGSSLLDRAALDAVARWRFFPARLDANPVDSDVLVPVRFRLE